MSWQNGGKRTLARWGAGAAILVAALVHPRHAQAQGGAVRIVVQEAASQAGIPNVVVSLVSAQGTVMARGLTGSGGSVTLTAVPRPLRVQARRIGFLSAEMVLPDSVAELRVTLQQAPRVLPPIVSSDAARCSEDPSRPEALALWDQARSALLTAHVARSVLPAQGELLLFRHAVAAIDDRALQQSVTRMTPSGIARPFGAAQSAADFAKNGYTEGPPGQPTLLAPDETVLFSDEFLETHCFALDRPAGNAGSDTVRLTFAPTLDRRGIVDIEGTVRMRREPVELVSIEFRYTGLPKLQREARSGGALRFVTMPMGYPLLQRWHIRSAGNTPTGMMKFDHMPAWMGVLDDKGIAVTGAEIGRLDWPDDTRWRSPNLVDLTGVIREGGVGQGNTTGRRAAEGTGAGVPGALVELEASPYGTVASNDGRFELPGVLPGLYMLSARDTMLAGFGLERASRAWIRVSADSASGREILMIPRETFLERRCRESSYGWPRGQGSGVILARVRTQAGTPVTGTFEVRPATTISGDWKPIAGPVSGGYFRVCRAPTSALEFTITTPNGSVRHASERTAGIRFVTIVVP